MSRWAALALWVVVVPACPLDADNCKGLRVGDQVEVTLVEPWDTQSRFPGSSAAAPLTCHDSIGFAANGAFVATLTDFLGNHGCLSGITETFALGGWTWTRDPALVSVPGGAVLEGLYLGQMGACTGRIRVVVQADRLPSTPPEPGRTPRATMRFGFDATGTSVGDSACPQTCGGEMVVSVAAL